MADEITPTTQTPQTESPQEPIPAPEPISEPQTAQFPPNEPLPPAPVEEVKLEPDLAEPEIPEVETPESKPETQASSQSEPKPQPQTEASLPSVPQNRNPIRELLNNARFAIQTRKKKKLEKILSLFAKRTSITNDEVEKLLHISDATATRYLTILKKENKIKQNGKIGKGVSYSKM